MTSSKHLLLFGAGKSATVLIDFLKQTATQKQWQVTVADGDFQAAQLKVGNHAFVKAMQVNIHDAEARNSLVQRADVVISLLPPGLHYLVALSCISFHKHLLTASYVDEKIHALAADIKEKGLLFLCEMGLDPGIDHMSAMQLIHRIHDTGGLIRSFRSHCGGLVAPENDDNPWHYKISWNPGNVVLAGKAGAVYKTANQVQRTEYGDLFRNCGEVKIAGLGTLAYYPNRDSLGYIETYGLATAATFVRTTLRHPAFCKGWQRIVELKLTDETVSYDTDGLTMPAFLEEHFAEHALPFTEKDMATDPAVKEQFGFLGLLADAPINMGKATAAEILQRLLEQHLVLRQHDRDMIVMLHELEYETSGRKKIWNSTLVVKGEDSLRTAMAKTVGLPLGIAAVLLLEGAISETGLHIPITPSIYGPVLPALEQHGIVFQERVMEG